MNHSFYMSSVSDNWLVLVDIGNTLPIRMGGGVSSQLLRLKDVDVQVEDFDYLLFKIMK